MNHTPCAQCQPAGFPRDGYLTCLLPAASGLLDKAKSLAGSNEIPVIVFHKLFLCVLLVPIKELRRFGL